MKANEFAGSWRITEMEMWDAEDFDLLGPATVEFGRDGIGHLRFIAVVGQIDYRLCERDGKPCVEFSWLGSDEMDEACGRGWAVLEAADRLSGRIYFHMGDDSSFTAAREEVRRSRAGSRAARSGRAPRR